MFIGQWQVNGEKLGKKKNPWETCRKGSLNSWRRGTSEEWLKSLFCWEIESIYIQSSKQKNAGIIRFTTRRRNYWLMLLVEHLKLQALRLYGNVSFFQVDHTFKNRQRLGEEERSRTLINQKHCKSSLIWVKSISCWINFKRKQTTWIWFAEQGFWLPCWKFMEHKHPILTSLW